MVTSCAWYSRPCSAFKEDGAGCGRAHEWQGQPAAAGWLLEGLGGTHRTSCRGDATHYKPHDAAFARRFY